MKDNPYKIIFSDMDLTLLYSGTAKISLAGAEAFKRAMQKGIKVCLVSSRHPRGIKEYFSYFGVEDMPYVAYNGALASAENDQWLHNYTIDTAAAQNICQIVMQSQIPGLIMMFAQDRWYTDVSSDPGLLKREIAYIGHAPECVDYRELFAQGIRPNKFYCANVPEHSLQLEKLLIQHSHGLHVSRSSQWSLDIMRQGVNKSVGIAAMLEHFGLDRSEAIAFGDSPNDIEMLQYVGLGVAVDNAMDSVKRVAQEVTLSNDQDGVAFFLRNKLEI